MLHLALLSAFAPVAVAADDTSAPLLEVNVGESVIRKEPRSIARVLISNPDVAELRILEEGQFQVRGVAVGNTDLWVWYRDEIERPRVYQVVVQADLTDISRRIHGAVGRGEVPPKVYPVRERLVVEGPVADVETLERVAAIARIYDEEFVNLMSVRGDHQVQLHVVFAEVSRTGLREIGLNLMGQVGPVTGAIAGPGQVESGGVQLFDPAAVPNVNSGAVLPPSSGVFNLMTLVTLGNVNIGGVLDAMEQNSLARTLARPNVVSLSGQQSELLAGGEVPIPVAQNNGRISIEFKEYGVKVVFVPTVLGGEVIDMRTYVEVSELDYSNSTRLSGLEIPAFVTRKADSHLRIEDGMTFAMAGMLKERTAATRAAIPLLGDLPVVGALFRYVKHQREETELVIFVTPELVRPLAPEEVPDPPGSTENFNPGDLELFLLGTLVQPGTRTAEPTGEIGMRR